MSLVFVSYKPEIKTANKHDRYKLGELAEELCVPTVQLGELAREILGKSVESGYDLMVGENKKLREWMERNKTKLHKEGRERLWKGL